MTRDRYWATARICSLTWHEVEKAATSKIPATSSDG